MKYTIYIALVVGLSSCVNNQIQKDLKEEVHELGPAKIIWVEVADSVSNFEALLSTNHLYYLEHMSVDYDNYGKDFWKSIDTIEYDNWTIKRFRKGACQNSDDTTQMGFCLEHQEHTINKRIDKVVKFSGSGSGYFATIEYTYDELGNLTEYKDRDKVFYLEYDSESQLTEVLITEINHGMSKKTGLIKFKELPTTKPKQH